MKPALALGPVHWQGEVVGAIRKFDNRRCAWSMTARHAVCRVAMAKAKHGSIFKHAVRPRLDRHHGGSRSPLVGGVDTDRQTVFCAHRGCHFRSGPISGTELAADSALYSRRIDRPVLEVRTRKRIHLAHDSPATALVAGNCASADPRDARSRPERSAPRQSGSRRCRAEH